jgi:purine-binding chemotaxis protein CheW
MMESSFLTFKVGSYVLGVSVDELIEVNRNLKCTKVPGSPKMIRGILNLRGLLMPAIDVGAYLEIADAKSESFCIVLNVQGNHIALMVDSIGDINGFNPNELVSPPTQLLSQSQEAILGAYRLTEGLLIILDTLAISRNAQNHNGILPIELQSLPVLS